MAGNIGASGVQAKAAVLEKQIRDGAAADVLEDARRGVEGVLEPVADAIRVALGTTAQEPPPTADAGATHTVAPTLAAVEAALTKGD